MDRQKFIKNTLYSKYGMKSKQNYHNFILTNLISNKNCHIVAILKESIIYDYLKEFLKRYYRKKDIYSNIKKYVNYYKNYLRFFCKPIFRNLYLNNLIQNNGEKKAEIYYQDNYGKKDEKEIKRIPKELKIIFSDTVRENINDFSNTEINNSSLTNQLNKSSFRILKNNNLEDFDKESITHLLNDLNGTSHTSSSNIHNTQRNKHNQNNRKQIRSLNRYNSPKIEKIQIDSNKNSPKNYNLNLYDNYNINLMNNNKIMNDIYQRNSELRNINLSLKNSKENYFISQSKLLNKLSLNNKSKLKLKIKSNKKKTLSNQMNSKVNLTEENNNIKKNRVKHSIDFTTTNYYNKRTKNSITESLTEKLESKKLGMINLKTKNVNQLKKQVPNINSPKNINLLSTFKNFEHQQQLLNNGKHNYKVKGSFNKSSRNKQSLITYTQTFSPQSNRPNSKFMNQNIYDNKLYKFSSKLGKIK